MVTYELRQVTLTCAHGGSQAAVSLLFLALVLKLLSYHPLSENEGMCQNGSDTVHVSCE